MASKQSHRPAWTVVQHSGYGYGGDPEFARGLEVRELGLAEPFAREYGRVTLARGLVFDSYEEAIAYEQSEPYPPGNDGLLPRAPGVFVDEKIDGLRIYVPPAALDREYAELGRRLAEWAGVGMDREQLAALAQALPNSSVPWACGVIGDAIREAGRA